MAGRIASVAALARDAFRLADEQIDKCTCHVSTGRCRDCKDAFKFKANILKVVANYTFGATQGDQKLEPWAKVARERAHKVVCVHCGGGAICFGTSEGHPPEPACDDCCAHGNEDGWCVPITLYGEPRKAL